MNLVFELHPCLFLKRVLASLLACYDYSVSSYNLKLSRRQFPDGEDRDGHLNVGLLATQPSDAAAGARKFYFDLFCFKFITTAFFYLVILSCLRKTVMWRKLLQFVIIYTEIMILPIIFS
jgi:hypothetical protein